MLGVVVMFIERGGRHVVVIHSPVVELHDQLTVGDETLVLRSTVVAVTAEQLLVPPATGFDVAYRDQRLGSAGVA